MKPVELVLTIQTAGACVSHRRSGQTVAEVIAQWPELVKAVEKAEAQPVLTGLEP